MADNNVNWDGWVTPDLARNPGLASDTLKSNQPDLVGPVLSYANKGVMMQDAINDHIEGNGTQSFWAKLGHGTVSGLEWLGKPLKEIQKDYKFTHAVYKDHGFLQGFAVTLGVIGGGVGGALLGGPVGAVVGADIAATGLRKLSSIGFWKDIYTDSYAKSQDEKYKVSPGRDFSNALAKASDAVGAEAAAKAFRNTDAGAGKVLSGIGDLGFDINSDPLMILGRFSQLMKAGKYLKLEKAGNLELKYPIMNTVPGVKQFIIERTKAALTSDQLDAVRAGNTLVNSVSRTYNRALEDIANSTAGEIAAKYPQLGTAAAGRLGSINNPEAVHNFLKTSLYFGELEGTLAGQAIIPTRTLLRAKAADSKVIDYLRNAESIPARVYKTFSGYMPYSVDAETQKLSLTKFRWNAPDAATTVYRMGRVGLGDSAAKIMAGKYAEAVAVNDLALARSIKNQTIFDTFKALGLPDDNAMVKKVYDEINKIDTPLVGTQIYGTDVLGRPLGEYISNQGPKVGGLVSHHAQDMFDIPDFFAIKKAMRDSGLQNKFVGKLDEFTANHYTNKIFKPLALATAGFGLRVAAAELIPTFARFGVINTFKAKLATSAAKANYELGPRDSSNVFSAAMVALGAHMGIAPDVMQAGFPAFQEAKRRGLNFAAKMLPEEQMDLATRLVLSNDGHIISEAVSTGHGYDASTSYQMNQSAHYYYQIQKNSPMFRDLPEYTTYTSSDIHYPTRYATNLNTASNEITNRNIATDLLEEVKAGKGYLPKSGQVAKPSAGILSSEFHATEEFQNLRNKLINKEYGRMLDATKGIYKGYDKEIKTLSRWVDSVSSGDLRSFAQDRVDSTLGMFFGKDGTFHENFAENVAKGKKVNFDEIVSLTKSNPQSLPAAVAGPMLQPYVPSNGMLVRITDLGFKKIIDPIVNGLAREPLYVMHVADAYARLAPRIASKQLTEDQALRIAQTQGSYAMLPQIHNTALRNQFSQLARNFLPFYFAQEQALKRAYNALKDTSIASPLFSRGLRFYQLAEHSLNDPAFVTENENGNKFINLPGVGALGEAFQGALAAYGIPMVTGLPISATGSLISLKSVLPELSTPGVSPVFAISGNVISDLFPATKDVVQGTIGDISFQRGILDTLVPAAWAKTALAALTPIDLTGQMANATASALATAYYYNQVPTADSNEYDRQAFIDRIKNNARSILLIKTFLNLTSPLAPQVSQEESGIRDDFWKLVKQKGNFADALTTFLGDHGSLAVSYTVAKTTSNVQGAKYPYIQSTVDFIKDNPKLFDPKSGLSSGGFFLIPQDNVKNESDRTIYNELMSMHLRSRYTPQELLKSFYVAQGDVMMSGQIREHVARMEQVSFDPFLKSQETKRWSEVMTKMKNLYPIWYSDYTSGERRTNAQTSYNQLIKIFSGENPPQHEQAKLVQALIKDYQAHQATMSQFKMLNLQGNASQQETQNWEDYLLTLSEKEPRLKSVIDGVFRKLG